MSDTFHGCRECIHYFADRGDLLKPAMADRIRQTGESAGQILERYMTGVHNRHLSGLSLEVTS